MSVLNPSKPYKNSFHRRTGSDELDVFEAAGYFSTTIESNPAAGLQKPGRMSLDRNPISSAAGEYQKLQMKEAGGGKKYKQPSSPGGRLASFLNSLFNQASLKKKKPKPGGGGGAAAEDEITGGRRKRRSSISHFTITTTTTCIDSSKSSSGSGFRTPPPYVDTPTKAYRRPEEVDSLPENLEQTTSFQEKSRIRELGFSITNSTANWKFRKFSGGDDDGAESDSSSDLFDLPNHELDFYSSGLPVYGTTNMERIKMQGAPISSATG